MSCALISLAERVLAVRDGVHSTGQGDLMTLNIDSLYNTWAPDTDQGERTRAICVRSAV